MAVIEQIVDPLSHFLYALKAPETRRQWPNRLKIVFDFLGLHGSLHEQAKEFMTLYKQGSRFTSDYGREDLYNNPKNPMGYGVYTGEEESLSFLEKAMTDILLRNARNKVISMEHDNIGI